MNATRLNATPVDPPPTGTRRWSIGELAQATGVTVRTLTTTTASDCCAPASGVRLFEIDLPDVPAHKERG